MTERAECAIHSFHFDGRFWVDDGALDEKAVTLPSHPDLANSNTGLSISVMSLEGVFTTAQDGQDWEVRVTCSATGAGQVGRIRLVAIRVGAIH